MPKVNMAVKYNIIKGEYNMCSIMGYCGKGISYDEFKKGFDKTHSRGPDDSKILDLKNGILAFHRLAIMDIASTGMQPFTYNKSAVICNGELYGFRKIKKELIKKGYHFKSSSDCEIILPLYEEYGLRIFEMLDAEFAMIIYDGESETYIAARDPIGIRPLYYGYDKYGVIVFASEPKNIVDIVTNIKPFPPGHYYKNGEFICYMDITEVKEICQDNVAVACNKIKEKLIIGIEKRLDADAPLGFLLSGGLDSSLVCAIAANILKKPIHTFAVGMNEDAIDLKYAKEVADYIGSIHTEIYITREDVLGILETTIYTLGTYDITTIRASIGMYLICKAIHETTDVRVLMTGEISDEMFGYKYTDFAPNGDAFQKESQKRIKELHMYDVLRADRCISANSLEARVPFGDIDLVKYVMSLDPLIKMNSHNMGKYLLRHAFEGDYLPQSILYREKAAFSDAVGHSMVEFIKEYAELYYTDKEFKEKIEAYTFAKPFTKESLLYREIFENFYRGQAEMVVDFWMPNKEWDGCNVDDPSARVLSNYGNSGK